MIIDKLLWQFLATALKLLVVQCCTLVAYGLFSMPFFILLLVEALHSQYLSLISS